MSMTEREVMSMTGLPKTHQHYSSETEQLKEDTALNFSFFQAQYVEA